MRIPKRMKLTNAVPMVNDRRSIPLLYMCAKRQNRAHVRCGFALERRQDVVVPIHARLICEWPPELS